GGDGGWCSVASGHVERHGAVISWVRADCDRLRYPWQSDRIRVGPRRPSADGARHRLSRRRPGGWRIEPRGNRGPDPRPGLAGRDGQYRRDAGAAGVTDGVRKWTAGARVAIQAGGRDGGGLAGGPRRRQVAVAGSAAANTARRGCSAGTWHPGEPLAIAWGRCFRPRS